MTTLGLKLSWCNSSKENKTMVVSRLLEILELSDKTKRMNAARCVLYLVQVCTTFYTLYTVLKICIYF